MTSQDQDHNGSFLNGFGIGLLAGACGYFLFGTKKGEKLVKDLQTEWLKAKKGMQDQGMAETQVRLRDYAADFFAKLGMMAQPTKKIVPVGKGKKPKVKIGTLSPPKKFKGT